MTNTYTKEKIIYTLQKLENTCKNETRKEKLKKTKEKLIKNN